MGIRLFNAALRWPHTSQQVSIWKPTSIIDWSHKIRVFQEWACGESNHKPCRLRLSVVVFVEAQSRRSGCALVQLRIFSLPCCSQSSLAQLSHACTERRIDIIISRRESKVASLDKLMASQYHRSQTRLSLHQEANALRSNCSCLLPRLVWISWRSPSQSTRTEVTLCQHHKHQEVWNGVWCGVRLLCRVVGVEKNMYMSEASLRGNPRDEKNSSPELRHHLDTDISQSPPRPGTPFSLLKTVHHRDQEKLADFSHLPWRFKSASRNYVKYSPELFMRPTSFKTQNLLCKRSKELNNFGFCVTACSETNAKHRVTPTVSIEWPSKKIAQHQKQKLTIDAFSWCGLPESATFWVNASRVLPPLTIANVKNPSIFISFFNNFFWKKEETKTEKNTQKC